MHTRFSARFAARVLIVGFGAICAASVATIAAAASEGPSTSSNSATSSQATVPSSTSGIPGIPDATAATAASAPTPHAVATGGTAAPQASVSVLLKNKRGDSHFKPGQSVEDVAARTEKAKQFINADGTTSEVLSTRPLHFKDFAGRWVDIDPTVEPDPAGGFQSTANAWQAHFSALPAGVTIDTAGGKVRFSPAGSASVAPQVLPDGQGVVYPDAWPGVDLRYRVEPDGVKEELVLKTRTVATTFAFDTKGLSYDPTPDGGLIASHGANTVGSIAPPELQDAQGTPQPDAHPALSATSKGNKSLVTVTVDPAFMTEAPDSAFPLVLDPSYNATLSNNANYKSDGYSCSWCGVRVGNSRDLIGGVSYDRYWRNVTYFDYAGIPGTPHINGATIDLTNLQGGTQNGYTISAYWASAYSYAGALSGGVLASVSGTDTYYATLSSPTLTAYYDWWVHSHIVGSALGFVGQEQSGLYTYKQFGTATLTLSWYTALPSAPTSPSIVAQPNGNLEAHWNPSADDGGAPIDKYTVTLYPAGSTTPAGTYDCNNCGPGSYVWWYGLADGSSWYYTITAHNSVGTGPAATTPTATVYYLPGVPGNLQNYAGNGQALATWTAAPTNNGPAIDSYLVNAYDNTTSTSHFANACGTCTSYQFMGLTNGHSYTFAVQAHNHWGYAQSYATAPNAITPATNVGPYPPQYPSASPGNASAWIAWDTPIANNGAAVTDYVIQLWKNACAGSGTFVTQTGPLSPAAGTVHNTYRWTLTALTNGQVYCFRIYPHNANNYGYFADTNTITPTASPPPYPASNVKATPGDSMVLVQWTASHPSGPAPTSYIVQEYDQATGWVAQHTVYPPSTVTLFTAPADTPVMNGHTYAYLVYAIGTNGNATPAASAWVTPQSALGDITKPTNVQAFRGNTAVTVTWTAPTISAVGVTTYRVKVYRASDNALLQSVDTPATAACAANPPTPTKPAPCLIVTGLKNGTAVYATVSALYLGLVGTESAHSGNVTPAGAPFAPENVVATAGDTVVTATWQPPSVRADGTPGNNGDPTIDAITSYTVTAYTSSDNVARGSATVNSAGGNPPPLTASVPGLKNGTSYYVKVKATNDIGTGPESAASSFVIPAGRPFKPVNVSATAARDGSGSATINWQAPPARADGTPGDNGRPLSSYTVTASPGGMSSTVNGSPPATSATVSGLTNGTSYTFAVTAANAIGTSDPSDPSNAVTPVGPPVPSGGVSATPTLQGAYVFWSGANANGGTLQGYSVTASPGGATMTTGSTTTNVTFAGLDPATTYSFAVSVTSDVGTSTVGTSNGAQPFASASAPDAPSAVSATPGNREAAVSWGSSSTHGTLVSGYTVTASPGGASVTTASGETTTATVPGLTNGVAYHFVVVANSSAGASPQSAPSSDVSPSAPAPPSPATVKDVVTDASSATITYAPPSGGGAVDHFTITSSDGKSIDAPADQHQITLAGFSSPQYDVTFAVYAKNESGTANAAGTEPINVGLPGRPPLEGVPAVGSVGFVWTDSQEFGIAVDHYEIDEQLLAPCGDEALWPPENTSCLNKLQDVPKGDPSTYHFSMSVDAGSCRGFSLFAVAGNGKKGLATEETVCEGTPRVPRNVVVTPGNNGSATITWDAPIDNGTPPILNYTVVDFPNDRDPFASPTTMGTTPDAATHQLTVQGLGPGITNRFRVTANNANGPGPYSAFTSAATHTVPTASFLWGVDSCTHATTAQINDVIAKTGKPAFYGRYVNNGGCTLDKAELDSLKAAGISALTFFTGPMNNNLGSANGTNAGNSVAEGLRRLGVPANDQVVVNLDIEPGASVDAAFLNSWTAAIKAAHFVPGLYVSANVSGQSAAVCGVTTTGVALWPFGPSPGRQNQTNAPLFAPAQFPCQGLTYVGWQFGIPPCAADGHRIDDAIGFCENHVASPNIDTDEVLPATAGFLWHF